MNQVAVFAIDTLGGAIRDLASAQREIEERCAEDLRNSEELLRETEAELQFSEGLLAAAQAEEAVKFMLLGKAQMRMAEALAAQATALASCNPLAIASAAAEVAAAAEELARATEEYERAREHRQRMEQRRELAQKCVNLAQGMLDTLNLRYQYGRARVAELVYAGSSRLQAAYDDLAAYLARISPPARQALCDYWEWKPREKDAVSPKEVHDRLDIKEPVADGLLEYLYTTDLKFRASIDRLCVQMGDSESNPDVEAKIKKNIVGRLCEELVIQAFRPMGERIETQRQIYLDNGSFTKVDMILHGLKEPVILGRGEGMAGKKGGSLAIEVKSGRPEYLYTQVRHMETQAKGHKECDASCTICTRDIMDLPPEKQQEVRERLRAAGSPILGMLPRKTELDTRCINFVKIKSKRKDVQ